MQNLTLMGKVARDPQFGKDQEYRDFYTGNRSNSSMSTQSNPAPDSTTANADKVIVDLDLIVEKWIQYMWETTKSKQQASKYEYEDLEMIVNWQKVDIMQDDAKFDGNALRNKVPSTQTLFRTYFTNKTDSEQEYSFKTERITRQSCSFSFLKGFSREKEGGLSVKFPQEILEIGGGLRSEQSVEMGKDQTKEEEISWGVDSLIKVQPHSRTIANLVITELNLETSFSIETKIKGRIVVTVNHRKENNAFVKTFSGDIVEIIRKAQEKNWLPPSSLSLFEIIDINGVRMARSSFKGKCRFKLGVEQNVTLEEEKLKQ